MSRKPEAPLRRGWTTGACAAAAAKAAYEAMLTGRFPDPVAIRLPRGQRPHFALAEQAAGPDWATAAIVKDAGDDPDITHGALVRATVHQGPPGSGVTFRGGEGIGTVTRPGLALPPGEPAINPAPRAMIRTALEDVAEACDRRADVVVTVAIPGGADLAERTWNPRLGIVGGLSVLGTTGVVVPYSCSAWVHSIHRGIDVARAAGLLHVAGATGRTSEAAVQRFHGLDAAALIDMGDFVGGLLKYVRTHPVPRLTIAGGFAKLTKLAQGHLDLHSARSQVDLGALADWAAEGGVGADAVAAIRSGGSAGAALAAAGGTGLAQTVAEKAHAVATRTVGPAVDLDVLVVDRSGRPVAHAG